MNDAETPSELPLAGLRVVDMTGEIGELAGRLLADFGADVIRLEPPNGARSRHLPPFAPDGTTSLAFAYRNFNKRGVVLDVDMPSDRHALLELLASADVFIDSARPGVLAALDLDHASLQERFPHLVSCSITPAGHTGPYAANPATADTLFAQSGWLTLSGIPEKPPLLVPGPLAYDIGGISGCFAILTALVQRLRDGRGQHLDVSCLEAIAQCNTWQVANMSSILNNGGAPNQMRQGAGVMYPSFPTSDGMIRLVVLSPSQWDGLFEWMGQPEEFADPSWREIVTRYLNTDVLNLAWGELFAPMKMVEVGTEAQRRGVVAAPMLKPDDVLASEHFADRRTFRDVEVASGVTGQVVDGFGEIDGSRAGFRFRAPALGEHTDEVLAEKLPAVSLPLSEPDGRQPLADVRVIDFGHGGVGVEGGRMLADYGADVIKIESRTYPDFIRIVMGGEMTPSFASSSRSKRSFGANTKNEAGRAVVHQLLATADIAIENTSTGTMASMGVDYATVADLNPRLTMASSQMMGSHGPHSSWIGYGPAIQALGGLSWLWNFTDGDPPPGTTQAHPDHMAGRLCAIAGLLGVLQRERTGKGMHVEMAQVEKLMATLGDLFLAESMTPGSVKPRGNQSDLGAPWGVYRCVGDDQWCVICVEDDDQWAALGRAMGSPGWTGDECFATASKRKQRRAHLDAHLCAWTGTLSADEVMSRCIAEGVPAARMLTAVDQLTDPHLVHRGFLPEVDQPEGGRMMLAGPAFRGSAMPEPITRPAPLIAEHTRDICRELGLGDDEVDALIAAGALEEN